MRHVLYQKKTSMSIEDRCVASGRRYSLGCDMADLPTVPSVVTSFVRLFEDHVSNHKDNPVETCRFLNVHLNGSPPIYLFISGGGVVDVVFMQIQAVGPQVLVISQDIFVTMNRVFDIGVNLIHFACGITPLVMKAFEERGDMHRILILVGRIASDEAMRDMMRDVHFFRAISTYISLHPNEMETVLPIVLNYADDVRLIDDSIRQILLYVGRAWSNFESAPVKCAVDFISSCFCENPSLRDLYTSLVVELWRTGWNIALGALLAYQLDTTSVEFVVLMAKKRKLDDLVALAYERTTIHWRAVRQLLWQQWPDCVARVTRHAVDVHTITSDDVCCPITQMPMSYPVVASDGHTYERDAIIRHVLSLGLWSPVTRLPISYHLYENRALLV